jgi:hypothetical protein
MTNPQNKIWAHRVNTLDNIQERLQEFKGVEVDIYYNLKNNSFSVKHDIDMEGLDLEVYIDSIINVKEVLFWFDYKNLNKNTDAGISKLCTILYERGLEKMSFIESYYGDKLERFSGKIATSFWVSSFDSIAKISDKKSVYLEKYKFIDDLNVNMLSASFEMFEFMSEYFPNRRCNYWMSGQLSIENKNILKEIASNPNVNVILIDGNRNFLRTEDL